MAGYTLEKRRLQPHDLAGPDALVGGEHDAERVDRGFVMLGEIDLAADRPEKEPLLALAEFLMAGFVFGRDQFVRLREAAGRVDGGMMNAKRVGFGMRVVVRGPRRRLGALARNNRHAAVRPDHVFDEM